jgi:hypothetical protein
MAMFFSQLARVVCIMAVNTQSRSIAEHAVNGIDNVQHRRKRSNESVNGNGIADNHESTRTEFPKDAGFFRRISKTYVLKLQNLITEMSKKNFRNRSYLFGNISESFLKIFSRKAAPVKEISEIEEYIVLVVIVRKSA